MTSDREVRTDRHAVSGKGYHAVILRYSVEPARYPLALLQLAKSVAFLRKMLQSFILIRIKLFCRAFPQVVIWQQVWVFSGRKILLHRHLG